MWMFRGGLDWRLLEDRLSRMGLVSEWRAFGGTVQNYQGKVSIPIADRQAFVVEFLGMVVGWGCGCMMQGGSGLGRQGGFIRLL